MRLFTAVPMTPSAAVSDFGGRRYRRFVPLNFLLFLAAPHLNRVLVYVAYSFADKIDSGDVDTSEQIAGIIVTSVNDTGDNCSSVSLSPAISENL
jgi:hypothetical protein